MELKDRHQIALHGMVARHIVDGHIPDASPIERDEMIWTTKLMLRSELILRQRKNMNDVYRYAHHNPQELWTLMKDLDKAVNVVNQEMRKPNWDAPYQFLPELAKSLHHLPLPRLFSNEEVMRCTRRYAVAWGKALTLEGEFMANAEKGQTEGTTWIEGHLRGGSPEARMSAILMHGYDLWVASQAPFENRVNFEDTLNPLCEALATHMRGSELFRILYDPYDLGWYEKGYGLTDEFIDYTDQLVIADSKRSS